MAKGRSKKTSRRKGRQEPDEQEPDTDSTGDDDEQEPDDEDEQEPADEDEQESDDDSCSDGEQTPPRKPLDKDEKIALFNDYQEAADTLDAAREALAEVQTMLAKKVKAIYDSIGPGPFSWQGRRIQIRKRKGTYFMTQLSSDVEEID